MSSRSDDMRILKAARILPTGIRRFSRAEVERMRQEMLTQYAPATELPEPRRPSKRYTLTDEEMI